jgi:hypothetical protein
MSAIGPMPTTMERPPSNAIAISACSHCFGWMTVFGGSWPFQSDRTTYHVTTAFGNRRREYKEIPGARLRTTCTAEKRASLGSAVVD